jgi:hypothetical protein
MTLSAKDRAELDRLGIENVRLKLPYAGASPGSVVPGLGEGFGMTRGDVETWVAERAQEASKQQADILWWAKAAALIGAAGIVVTIAIAWLGR